MSAADTPLMEQISDEFVTRIRRGERPSIEEYQLRYPALAGEIEDILPALEMLEQCRAPQADRSPCKRAMEDEFAPQVIGEYRIIQEVGRGGMGIVYEAQHETMDRRVALKVLPANSSGNKNHLQRFYVEARAAGQLHHSNIVPVFEVGEHDGLHFYAMQFIRGQALDQVIAEIRAIRANGDEQKTRVNQSVAGLSQDLSRDIARSLVLGSAGLNSVAAESEVADRKSTPAAVACGDTVSSQQIASPENVAQIRPANTHIQNSSEWSTVTGDKRQYFHRIAALGIQVAGALEHAHQSRILHRDIKPANLILDTAGTIWVTDFGLAKNEDSDLTRTGDIVGTLRYMAPERFQGESDARSDLYSLGLTLYEMCTLRNAFESTDRASLVHQVTTQTPTAPKLIDPHIPLDLETIVLKCIERDPEQRYRTAAQVQEDLQLFLSDRPIKARRVSTLERLWRICRRNPLPATMATCILGLLICVAVIASWFAVSSRNHAIQLGREKDQSRENLFRAQIEQARAIRRTHERTRRSKALAVLEQARTLLPELHLSRKEHADATLELRNEMIASLANAELQVERVWKVEDGQTDTVAFDADYKRYAQADAYGNIRVRTIDGSGDDIFLKSHGELAWFMEFSPDGNWLVSVHRPTVYEHTIYVWDLRNPGEILFEFHQDRASRLDLEFSPSGDQLAIATFRSGINLYSMTDGSLVRNVPSSFRLSAKIAWKTNDKIVVVPHDENRVEVWSTGESPMELESTETTGIVAAVCWDSNLDRIAVGTSDGRIHIWKSSLAVPPVSLAVHRSAIYDLHFQSRGNLIVSRARDLTIGVTDTSTMTRQIVSEQGLEIVRCGFISNGSRVAFHEDNSFGVWRVPQLPLDVLSSDSAIRRATTVDWHPELPLLARLTETHVEFWNVSNKTLVARLPTELQSDISFSPDGSAFYSCGKDSLKKWDLSCDVTDGLIRSIEFGEPEIVLDDPGLWYNAIQFTHEGNGLIVCSGSPRKRTRTACLLNTQTGKIVTQFEDDNGLSIGWISPDDKWLVARSFREAGARVFDMKTGKSVKVIDPAFKVSTASFHPQGHIFAARDAQNVNFLTTATWDCQRSVAAVARKGRTPQPIRYTPTGNILAVATGPGMIQLLNSRDRPATGGIEIT